MVWRLVWWVVHVDGKESLGVRPHVNRPFWVFIDSEFVHLLVTAGAESLEITLQNPLAPKLEDLERIGRVMTSFEPNMIIKRSVMACLSDLVLCA